MSQSLYTSMGGISAAQSMLEVVSDNIANINTTAFKESEVNFANLFSQTLTSGTSASSVTGGTNPIQIGLGVQLSSISKNFTSGTWQATGRTNDLMIEGKGFFCVRDSAGNSYLSKAGDLSVDSSGNLVTADGYNVVGTDALYSTTSSDVNVKIPQSITSKITANTAFATKNLGDLNNLIDGDITTGTATFDVTVTGASVNPIPVSINITSSDKTMQDIVNKFNTALAGTNVTIGAAAPVALSTLVSVSDASTTGGTVQFKATNPAAGTTTVGFDSSSTSNFFLTTQLSGAKASTDTTVTPNVNTYSSAALDFKATIDPATSLTDTIGIKTHSIQGDGSIAVTYSNGDSLTVKLNTETQKYEFQYTTSAHVVITGDDVVCNPNVASPANMVVQLASVTNEDGLISVGANRYQTGQNSGTIMYSVGGAMGMGKIASGGLESSNVDISKQFSNMIVAQRAIQANSRVFSTSSDILQTIVQLGR